MKIVWRKIFKKYIAVSFTNVLYYKNDTQLNVADAHEMSSEYGFDLNKWSNQPENLICFPFEFCEKEKSINSFYCPRTPLLSIPFRVWLKIAYIHIQNAIRRACKITTTKQWTRNHIHIRIRLFLVTILRFLACYIHPFAKVSKLLFIQF